MPPEVYGVVYALLDPQTGKPRYIGRSTNLPSRLRDHQRGRRSGRALREWLAGLGQQPVWMVLDECPTEARLLAAEQAHIALARANGDDLLNVGQGGANGRYDSAERRRAQRKQRERGVSIYIPADELVKAGLDLDAPIFYRVWGSPRGAVVKFYKEK